MMDSASNSFALILLSVMMGMLLGAIASWLLSGRNKSIELSALQKKCQQLELALLAEQKSHEATVEKGRWLEQAEETLREAFEALASRSLQTNADELLKRSKTELQHLVEPLDKDLEKLDSQIRALEEKREGAYKGLQEHLRHLNEAQISLKTQTLELNQALRSSTSQGNWGELQLRRVVELAGMVEHVDFEEQATGKSGRPDMVVMLPNGGILPVDAKAPMQAYLSAMEATDDADRSKRLQEHVRAVRGRIRDLSGKEYWEQFEQSPQFVVMFIPNEACLSASFQQDGTLLDHAMQARVLVASPVTLLALLKAVGYGWQQLLVTENARLIAEEGKRLYRRIRRLNSHLESLGTSLGQAVDAYNRSVGSVEHRLIPSARRFEELGIEADKLAGPRKLDHTVRSLSAPNLLEE